MSFSLTFPVSSPLISPNLFHSYTLSIYTLYTLPSLFPFIYFPFAILIFLLYPHYPYFSSLFSAIFAFPLLPALSFSLNSIVSFPLISPNFFHLFSLLPFIFSPQLFYQNSPSPYSSSTSLISLYFVPTYVNYFPFYPYFPYLLPFIYVHSPYFNSPIFFHLRIFTTSCPVIFPHLHLVLFLYFRYFASPIYPHFFHSLPVLHLPLFSVLSSRLLRLTSSTFPPIISCFPLPLFLLISQTSTSLIYTYI